MYTSSDFISITEARKNFSTIIDNLPKEKHKLIIRNNAPAAVLVDFTFYEKLKKENDIQLKQDDFEIVTDKKIVDTINKVNGTNSNSIIFG